MDKSRDQDRKNRDRERDRENRRSRERGSRERDTDRDGGSHEKADTDRGRRRRSRSRENEHDIYTNGENKKKSQWGGIENDKTFKLAMPTILPADLDPHQQESYQVQLQIDEISRKLRTGDFAFAFMEQRSPSPEPVYRSDGKRVNTRRARACKLLKEQLHQLVIRMQRMNPEFKPPADYKPPVIRVSEKVLIPQEQHPDINFIGLLIGPRGTALKALANETGARIFIKGKGSVKEGNVGRKYGQDEPLHARITAPNPECLTKAVDKIKDAIRIIIEEPKRHYDLKNMQLREVAQVNGTLRDKHNIRCWNCRSTEHKNLLCPKNPNVTNNIVGSSYGGAAHIVKDCRSKRPGTGGPPSSNVQAKNVEEYLRLMADRPSFPKAIAAPPLITPPWNSQRNVNIPPLMPVPPGTPQAPPGPPPRLIPMPWMSNMYGINNQHPPPGTQPTIMVVAVTNGATAVSLQYPLPPLQYPLPPPQYPLSPPQYPPPPPQYPFPPPQYPPQPSFIPPPPPG